MVKIPLNVQLIVHRPRPTPVRDGTDIAGTNWPRPIADCLHVLFEHAKHCVDHSPHSNRPIVLTCIGVYTLQGSVLVHMQDYGVCYNRY